jgi:hypothetical protein
MRRFLHFFKFWNFHKHSTLAERIAPYGYKEK